MDLTGRKVAVIGTGASAIQIGPAIAEKVAELRVYQRTADTSAEFTLTEESDPLCMNLADAAALLAGAPWRRYAVIGRESI